MSNLYRDWLDEVFMGNASEAQMRERCKSIGDDADHEILALKNRISQLEKDKETLGSVRQMIEESGDILVNDVLGYDKSTSTYVYSSRIIGNVGESLHVAKRTLAKIIKDMEPTNV